MSGTKVPDLDDQYPQSVEEAKEHIRQIRRDKGLGDGPDQVGNNASDLESALQVLSQDLYQTSTHFLLELIQNADDNFYTTDTPTLSIGYSPGKIKIYCNERGFSKSNLEAICRICKSTKSGRSKSAGFVGEKGIGFKAVFKVASVVWISSGYYSFKFNRDGHLGMIAPIWEEFPEKVRKQGTSICLQLAKDCDEKRIIQELASYDEKLLLFLRRLRRLEISAKPPLLSTARAFESVLARQANAISEASNHAVLLRNGQKKNFFVWRHTAQRMPKDVRRQGITSSEIVIAFPYKGQEGKWDVEPETASQDVYAFLPIRNCGFPFLLQADFLLSANREDVHEDSAWNKTLATSASKAFIEAVQAMGNLENALRWRWLSYMPCQSSQTPFFEAIRKDMIASLRAASVLEAESGRKRLPAKLTYVPQNLRDRTGRPFADGGGNDDNYLASSYVKHGFLWSNLQDLGVVEQSKYTFQTEMQKLLRWNASSTLSKKSKAWHEDFAHALYDATNNTGVTPLPIIPLRNGSWVSSNDKKRIFFPDKNLAKVPGGIDIHIVDDEAAASPIRKKLFERHHVRHLDNGAIREMIVSLHTAKKPNVGGLSAETLRSHVEFFFNTRHESAVPPIMQLALDTGGTRASDLVYQPSDIPSAASNVLPRGPSQKYGFLHSVYMKFGSSKSEREEFLLYLRTALKVAIYPRFTQHPSSTLHDDFKVLMDLNDRNLWLVVLKDGWSKYQLSFQYVKAQLETRSVRTKKGSVEHLAKTWMPHEGLVKEYSDFVSFIDVPDPAHELWSLILSPLKVGMEDNIHFYTRCLEGARRMPSVTDKKIKRILHELEDRAADQAYGIHSMRTSFSENELVFLPADGPGVGRRWVSPAECFWRGEPWITQSIGLADIHPDLETLFRTYLQISNSNSRHVIKEAEAIPLLPQPVPVERLVKVILALNKLVKSGEFPRVRYDQLKSLRIFPIVSTPKNEPYEYLTSVDSKQPWLIADRAGFRQHFQNVVPVLAFKPDFIFKIRRLLEAVGLQDRYLSKLASSVTEAHGDVNLDKKLTKEYRDRAKHLFRLIPEDQENRSQMMSSFKRVEVYTTPKVVQFWRTTLGLGQVQSAPTEGAAFMEIDYAGDLRLYVRTGYLEEGYPCELADQLRIFFNVPTEHRDLVTAAISASDERVEALFESRGIIPWFEEETADGDEENNGKQVAYDPVYRPGPSKKSRLRISAEARFTSLFGPTRFTPSFFKENNASRNDLPTYNAAVARSTQNAIGRPAEPRTFSNALTLPSLKGALRDLDFVQTGAAVVGTPSNPITIFDRFRGITQRDADIGEMIVSDILSTVLGPQYEKKRMWAPKEERKNATAAFNFTDTQGRFSSFLMRLDGMPGKAQGYNRLIYHLDVKATNKDHFKITQDELTRARDNSVHSQPDPEEAAPSKHVSILVHISDVRSEPKIRFLADPWDLFEDGQLILENSRTYHARLNLRLRPAAEKLTEETGFDAVQFKAPEDVAEEDPAPDYEADDTKGKKVMKRPEMSEAGDSGISLGEKPVAGPSGTSGAALR